MRPRSSFVLAAVAISLAIAACGGSTTASPGRTATASPSAPTTASVELGRFVCPRESTPDQPGPVDQVRPKAGMYLGSMVFDRGSGRMVLLTSEGKVWTFDVCTNTWEVVPESGAPSGWVLVQDADSGLFLAIDRTVWAYDLDRRTWTRKGGAPFDARWRPEAVYDPVTGLVVVRDPHVSLMWTYDVATDTWAEIDQGDTLPPRLPGPLAQGTYWAHALLSYDASVDRLVLYLGDNCTGIPEGDPGCPLGQSTWEFDLRAHQWTELEVDTPDVGFGWVDSGNEMAYDDGNKVSVVFSLGTAAAYDASVDEWQVVFSGVKRDPMSRTHFAMAYDPVNERMVVFGGNDANDVWAFDGMTGEWIQLLAPAEKTHRSG